MLQDNNMSGAYTLLYGLATKSCFEMTTIEWKNAVRTAFERAKEVAFSRGLPIIYGKNGQVIAEYSDGRRFIRVNGKDVEPYEGD